MWSNGDDFNEDGERVRLYQPIAYSSGRNFSLDDPTASFIGGPVATALTPGASFCTQCQQPLERLVQLYIPPKDCTYQVLGCNRAKCVNTLFFGDNKFHVGGNGVFQCVRVEQVESNECAKQEEKEEEKDKLTPKPSAAPKETSDWSMDSDDDDDEDDNLEELEKQVAAMEMKEPKTTKVVKKTTNKTNKKKTKSASDGGLPCFELHSLLEPPSNFQKSRHEEDDDDDDDDSIVGGMGGGKDDAKIQQMLAKYMAEEDDEDILTALQGVAAGSGSGGGKGNKSREKDERLKAADRALFTFTDRIKRSPRQVLRHASGGVPLWSVPGAPQPPSATKETKISFKEQKQKSKKNGHASQQPLEIPKCACGAERRFEFQLMPSLLHVLEVDKRAIQAEGETITNNSVGLDAMLNQDYGGMNWGTVAAFVCPNGGKSSACSQEEFLIVQASVDEAPQKRTVAPSDAAVIIQADQKFDALCDDGDFEGDYDDEDDDNESQVDEKDLVFTLDG